KKLGWSAKRGEQIRSETPCNRAVHHEIAAIRAPAKVVHGGGAVEDRARGGAADVLHDGGIRAVGAGAVARDERELLAIRRNGRIVDAARDGELRFAAERGLAAGDRRGAPADGERADDDGSDRGGRDA